MIFLPIKDIKKYSLNKKKLSKNEVKTLIESGIKFEKEYSENFIETFPNGKIEKNLLYRLPDENILFVYAYNGFFTPGKGEIFTEEFIKKWIKELKRLDNNKFHSSVEQWRFYSKYQNGIVNNIDKLILELADNLNISKKLLNKSYKSISIIENELKNFDLDYIFEMFYDNLIVYVGEVIKERVNGKWELNRFFAGDNYPFISIDLKNIQYMPLNVVYSALNELDHTNLKSETANEIRRNTSSVIFEREYSEKLKK